MHTSFHFAPPFAPSIDRPTILPVPTTHGNIKEEEKKEEKKLGYFRRLLQFLPARQPLQRVVDPLVSADNVTEIPQSIAVSVSVSKSWSGSSMHHSSDGDGKRDEGGDSGDTSDDFCDEQNSTPSPLQKGYDLQHLLGKLLQLLNAYRSELRPGNAGRRDYLKITKLTKKLIRKLELIAIPVERKGNGKVKQAEVTPSLLPGVDKILPLLILLIGTPVDHDKNDDIPSTSMAKSAVTPISKVSEERDRKLRILGLWTLTAYARAMSVSPLCANSFTLSENLDSAETGSVGPPDFVLQSHAEPFDVRASHQGSHVKGGSTSTSASSPIPSPLPSRSVPHSPHISVLIESDVQIYPSTLSALDRIMLFDLLRSVSFEEDLRTDLESSGGFVPLVETKLHHSGVEKSETDRRIKHNAFEARWAAIGALFFPGMIHASYFLYSSSSSTVNTEETHRYTGNFYIHGLEAQIGVYVISWLSAYLDCLDTFFPTSSPTPGRIRSIPLEQDMERIVDIIQRLGWMTHLILSGFLEEKLPAARSSSSTVLSQKSKEHSVRQEALVKRLERAYARKLEDFAQNRFWVYDDPLSLHNLTTTRVPVASQSPASRSTLQGPIQRPGRSASLSSFSIGSGSQPTGVLSAIPLPPAPVTTKTHSYIYAHGHEFGNSSKTYHQHFLTEDNIGSPASASEPVKSNSRLSASPFRHLYLSLSDIYLQHISRYSSFFLSPLSMETPTAPVMEQVLTTLFVICSCTMQPLPYLGAHLPSSEARAAHEEEKVVQRLDEILINFCGGLHVRTALSFIERCAFPLLSSVSPPMSFHEFERPPVSAYEAPAGSRSASLITRNFNELVTLGALRTLRLMLRTRLHTSFFTPSEIPGSKEVNDDLIHSDKGVLPPKQWFPHPDENDFDTKGRQMDADRSKQGWGIGACRLWLPKMAKAWVDMVSLREHLSVSMPREAIEKVLVEVLCILKDFQVMHRDAQHETELLAFGEDFKVDVTPTEAAASLLVMETLAQAVLYLKNVRNEDDSPYRLPLERPREAPSAILQYLCDLLDPRQLYKWNIPETRSCISRIALSIAPHLEDRHTQDLLSVIDMTPTSSTWFDDLQAFFISFCVSDRPLTTSTMFKRAVDVWSLLSEWPVYRERLGQLIFEHWTRCTKDGKSHDGTFLPIQEMVWNVFKHELIARTRDGSIKIDIVNQRGVCHDILQLIEFATSSTCSCNGEKRLSPDHPTMHLCRATIPVDSCIDAFSQLVALDSSDTEYLFSFLLKILVSSLCQRARLAILNFLMRLRATIDHRIIITRDIDEDLRTFSIISRNFTAVEGEESHAFEAASHTNPLHSPGVISEILGSSLTLSETTSSKEYRPRPGLESHFPGYLYVLIKLLDTEKDWDIFYHVLTHLPIQLSNKHLFCTARDTIQRLLDVICLSLANEKLGTSVVNMPRYLKLRDVRSEGYHLLATLISYQSMFDPYRKDRIIQVLIHGLQTGIPTTLTRCLSALSLAAYDLDVQLARHLPTILDQLERIMSNAAIAVHILAFLHIVGSRASLYANFTDEHFKTVFVIASKYLKIHNDSGANKNFSFALTQHVLVLTFNVIYTWFLALHLEDRRKYVGYIMRQILQANNNFLNEPAEVCFDWLARYTYANVDPQPGPSPLRDAVMHAPSLEEELPNISPETIWWLMGSSIISARAHAKRGWFEIEVRRTSGMTRFLCRAENFPHVPVGVVNPDLVSLSAMTMMNRIPSNMILGSTGIPGNNEEVVDIIRDDEMGDIGAERPDSTTGYVWSGTAPSQRREEVSPGPQCFGLQLSPYPNNLSTMPEINVTNLKGLLAFIGNLDLVPVIDTHTIGVLYVSPGQIKAVDIFLNGHGSPAYMRFLEGLGRMICIRNQTSVYVGGLNPDIDGEYAIAWRNDVGQLLYHVATMMPSVLPDGQDAFINKLSHVGNDYVKIIWNDSGLPYDFNTIPGAYNYVNIIIEANTPGVASAYTNDDHDGGYFKVYMQRKTGMPDFGPLETFQIISALNLSAFVRQVSTLADWFSKIYQKTDDDTKHEEYITNWRYRLQRIKQLKERAMPLTPETSRRRDENPFDFTSLYE